MQWSEIYWMLWAAAHTLRLSDGGLVSADRGHFGRFHPGSATFEDSAQWGVYSCCNGAAVQFNPWGGSLKGASAGCKPRSIKLAPAVSAPPARLVESSAVPAAAREYCNDENRVRVANKAKKAMGVDYSDKFGEQVSWEGHWMCCSLCCFHMSRNAPSEVPICSSFFSSSSSC